MFSYEYSLEGFRLACFTLRAPDKQGPTVYSVCPQHMLNVLAFFCFFFQFLAKKINLTHTAPDVIIFSLVFQVRIPSIWAPRGFIKVALFPLNIIFRYIALI